MLCLRAARLLVMPDSRHIDCHEVLFAVMFLDLEVAFHSSCLHPRPVMRTADSGDEVLDFYRFAVAHGRHFADLLACYEHQVKNFSSVVDRLQEDQAGLIAEIPTEATDVEEPPQAEPPQVPMSWPVHVTLRGTRACSTTECGNDEWPCDRESPRWEDDLPICTEIATETGSNTSPSNAGSPARIAGAPTLGRAATQISNVPPLTCCGDHHKTEVAPVDPTDSGAVQRCSFDSADTGLKPGSLELWPVWSRAVTHEETSAVSNSNITSVLSLLQMNRIVSSERHARRRCEQRVVCPPMSFKRIAWDVLSLVVISWDILTIPLMAFGFDDLQHANQLRLATTVFWTADICFSFFCGYYDGSVVVLKLSKTVEHYLKSFFIPDVTIVSIDWSLLLWEVEDSTTVKVARISKSLRIMSLLRVLRLIRIMKFVSLFEELTSIVVSDTLVMAINIAKLLLGLMFFNHVVACGWYAVGAHGLNESAGSWAQSLEDESAGIMYRYVTSFHWSLAQFTPAPSNVHPQNILEKGYAVGVVLFGMMLFSSFLGNMTSLITQIRNAAAQRLRQQELVRRFIAENNVTMELGTRITRFLRQQHWKQKKRVREVDLPVFDSLPDSVVIELHFQVYGPYLVQHPFFFQLAETNGPFVNCVCHQAVSDAYIMPESHVFESGAEASSMYVLRDGRALYSMYLGQEVPTKVKPGHMVSEAALWSPWRHRGTLSAKGHCTFMVLNSAKFREIAEVDETACIRCRKYAQAFMPKISELLMEGELSDIWLCFDDLQDLAQRAFEDCDKPERYTQRARHLWRQRVTTASLLHVRTTFRHLFSM